MSKKMSDVLIRNTASSPCRILFGMRLASVLCLFYLASAGFGQTAIKDPKPLGLKFEHYTCKDAFDRTIDFYLSPAKSTEKLPLAVIVLGSGGQSIWIKQGDQVYGGLQNLFDRAAAGKVRVLAVEKPGVPFCFQGNTPGTAINATKEFLEEHTLDRWTEAINSAVNACHKLPGIDSTKTLAVGHSEGGIVVSRLAALNPKITDVAVLAGGGASQLYEFFELLGREPALQGWKEIQQEPMSTTKMQWGHPNRRWTTFFATSPVEEALKSKARFFIGQGTADKASLPASAQILYASLLAKGRDATLELVEGGDHGFQTPGEPQPQGLEKMFSKVIKWFTGS